MNSFNPGDTVTGMTLPPHTTTPGGETAAMISRDVEAKGREDRHPVLVVDDDPNVVALARAYLERDGYRVVEANDGCLGLELARKERPCLVVLDLMLPGLDGFEVCQILQVESMVPVIMLTARVEEGDRLEGLELGADDYITKPFSPRDLAARVRAVLRRSGRDGAVSAHPELAFGTIRVNLRTRRATVEGEELKLTPTEFRLLTLLLQEPGRIFSRDEIIERALGYDFDGFARAVDTHVSCLRRKLEAESRGSARQIETVYGSGYRLRHAASA